MRTREQEVAAFSHLRVRDVARRLACTAEHVIHLIEGGELEAVNIALGERKMYRVNPRVLDAFIETRKIGAQKAVR